MGEINRARELRVDEISFRKFRENHETIQQITSQLQQMQEQMNFMNDSDVKSNLSGTLFHGPSQLVMIPNCRCLHNRGPLDIRNKFGLQEVFWKSLFYVCFTRRSSSTIQSGRRAKKLARNPWSQKDEDHLHNWRQTRSKHDSNADICHKAVDCDFYNAYWFTSGQHCSITTRTNVSNAIRPLPFSTIVLDVENSIQNLSDCLFWFSIGCYVVDQGSGDGWSYGRVSNPHDQLVRRILQTSRR